MTMKCTARGWVLGAGLCATVASGAADRVVPIAAKDLPAGHYVLDKHHASLTWQIRHLGISKYTARFTGLNVDLNFDPVHAQNIKVAAQIDPLSVRTDFVGQKNFDEDIAKSERFLNAGKFPTVTFESRHVTRTAPGHYAVVGDLSMLGASKPVTLQVTLIGAIASHPLAKVPAVGFEARTTLRRGDWGMRALTPAVLSDAVEVVIEAEFLKAKE